MADLNALKEFDLDAADVSLWVFKKSSHAGVSTFTGRWVGTTPGLDTALRTAVSAERNRIEEAQEYGLLTENNEASALSIPTLETHAGLLVEQAAILVEDKKVENLKQLQNCEFYAVKFVRADVSMFAVKKTDASWRTKKARGLISVIFSDEHLDLENDPGFSISRQIDFFILGDDVFINQKKNFESVLNYKQAHKEDFVELQAEPEFSAIFTDLAPLVTHVGENKIQLRRMSAIRQKGHYKNDEFMQNLRDHHTEYGLQIEFDGDGRIVPTPATCRDVMLALLDHRLNSAFSNIVYDVQDTKAVPI